MWYGLKIQKSFDNQEAGTVYVVPTPIGNLEDITYRALNVLRTVNIIAAEDTRNTKKLLNHFDIATHLTSYHEHNKEAKEGQLIARLENGESIAIVSDAGMPGVSDPGYEIVRTAINQDFPVVVLPGANAALCALVGSGLPSTEFLFYGFLPRKKQEKHNELERLQSLQATLLFYESPFRVKDTLAAILEVLGNRQIAIARELTKRYEEYTRGNVDEIIGLLEEKQLKGEFCIVVEGSTDEKDTSKELWWGHLSVIEHVNHYIDNVGMHNKEAIKQVAKDRQMAKRAVYQMYHVNN
ncbi:16S rRNA (cytidine(1402)-2'-O)-methyltransferase [Virgibacillus dakarensis]|uniref:16S rRNA (cytidine(1402)-2'-O)-methyltransferase n=1 Tax=Lentibacillus populi TaxID=1827502 RepID=UPI000C866465|nr:16S rRNA (cytidine(1402)-2'-O)-methyltransferase [Lentibacillus populi]MBT2215789.1 16S rRNA (cytidine(1402)-2'-O)-methyltransferase [Virgibacillus dakarensis]MTW86502.1 16S rRNA (cytidine(1402)-2'-O)-methyltransferase [Virgibacillus dakarensis]